MTALTQPGSRYVRARQEWDDRFAGLARGKRNWQLASLGLLLGNLVLASALAWLSTQSRITPYVVEVDALGQAAAFGPAERLRKTDERLIRHQLSLFVRNLRTVVGDAEAQKEILTRAYAFTTGPAVTALNDYFLDRNPFEVAQRQRVQVQVRSILPLSDASWQIQWTERATSLHAQQDEQTHWQAILTVELDPPRSTESILANPLGLFVAEITWTQTL